MRVRTSQISSGGCPCGDSINSTSMQVFLPSVRGFLHSLVRPLIVPSQHNKCLQAALAGVMKNHGFRKTGATWRKTYPESIGVVNIQGSQWGPSFYINLGVYFVSLGERVKPNEYECHIRCRLDELVPDRDRLNQILNFEIGIDSTVRDRELESALGVNGIRWLDHCSTVVGAAEYARGLPTRSPWITKNARALLGLPAA